MCQTLVKTITTNRIGQIRTLYLYYRGIVQYLSVQFGASYRSFTAVTGARPPNFRGTFGGTLARFFRDGPARLRESERQSDFRAFPVFNCLHARAPRQQVSREQSLRSLFLPSSGSLVFCEPLGMRTIRVRPSGSSEHPVRRPTLSLTMTKTLAHHQQNNSSSV